CRRPERSPSIAISTDRAGWTAPCSSCPDAPSIALSRDPRAQPTEGQHLSGNAIFHVNRRLVADERAHPGLQRPLEHVFFAAEAGVVVGEQHRVVLPLEL